MIRLAIPAAIVIIAMFTVPSGIGNIGQLAYILITNILISAVIYTMIATPFAAVMVVRTNSNQERSVMGTFRAIGNYGAGMLIAILTIPITNALGGTQSAWIKYGVIIALICLLLFFICYKNITVILLPLWYVVKIFLRPILQNILRNMAWRGSREAYI